MKLTLTRKQARVIQEAVELYSRLYMGQVAEIKKTCFDGIFKTEPASERTKRIKEAEHYLRMLKIVLFPELAPSAYYGIRAPEISDDARVAYDLHQVIRRHLAGPRPEGGFPYVCYDEPRQTSQEQLAVMED